MDNTFSPIVITSKTANQHLNGIKNQHSELIQGMQQQSARVSQFNADKQLQMQAQDQQAKAEQQASQKQQMDSQAKILEQQNKAQELAIKQQALSMP